MENDKPNMDERLAALRESVELLTLDIREMQEQSKRDHERMLEMDRRERRGRLAILRGIAEYMRALNGEDGTE